MQGLRCHFFSMSGKSHKIGGDVPTWPYLFTGMLSIKSINPKVKHDSLSRQRTAEI